MRPLIGLTPSYREEPDACWLHTDYLRAVERAGGLPVALPLTGSTAALAALCRRLDGVLLTGGPDPLPALYGEETLPCCGAICPQRDEMELALTREALRQGLPLLGICRGIQVLNVALGGTLYQDVAAQTGTAVNHQMEKPYSRAAHGVAVAPGSPLFRLLGQGRLAVNSCHHQAVRRLAPQLAAMAQAEDGLAEAVWMPGRPFVWAVQWHPERLGADAGSPKIFAAFAAACARRREGAGLS